MLEGHSAGLALLEVVMALLIFSLLMASSHVLVIRSQKTLASIAQAIVREEPDVGVCINHLLAGGQVAAICGNGHQYFLVFGNP